MNWFVEWWQFMFSSFWIWLGSLILIATITGPAYTWFKVIIRKTKTFVDPRKKEKKDGDKSDTGV